MIKLAFSFLLLLFSSVVSAQVWTGTQVCGAGLVQKFANNCFPTGGYLYGSGVDACRDGVTGWNSTMIGAWVAPTCHIMKKSGGADGGSCTIVYSCEAPPPPPQCPGVDVGSMGVTMMHTSGPSLGSAIAGGPYTSPDAAVNQTFCAPSNCFVKPKGPPTSCGQSSVPDSKGYYAVTCNYDMAQTGGGCTQSGSNTPSHSSPDGTSTGKSECPPGTVAAGTSWSGMTTCVGDGKTDPKPPITTTEKPPTTTPNPDGGSTTTSQKTTTNADGSTTTTTTTTVTNPDGSTSTTTASDTKKPDGTSGEQDKPDSDLCKLNPSLTICKNSQVLGKCGDISCTGDAIQCATLRAAAAMECRQVADVKTLTDSDAFKLGTAAAAGNDPQKGTFPGVGNATLVSMPAMSTAGWLAGGALPSDKSFIIQGKTVVVPLSKALAYLVVLRYALMVVALLVSFRILSGAIIRE